MVPGPRAFRRLDLGILPRLAAVGRHFDLGDRAGAVVASDGAGPITQVEVSADGGKTWHNAEIKPPGRPWAWHHWSVKRILAGGKQTLMSCATMRSGRSQPMDESSPSGIRALRVERRLIALSEYNPCSISAVPRVAPPSFSRRAIRHRGSVPMPAGVVGLLLFAAGGQSMAGVQDLPAGPARPGLRAMPHLPRPAISEESRRHSRQCLERHHRQHEANMACAFRPSSARASDHPRTILDLIRHRPVCARRSGRESRRRYGIRRPARPVRPPKGEGVAGQFPPLAHNADFLPGARFCRCAWCCSLEGQDRRRWPTFRRRNAAAAC